MMPDKTFLLRIGADVLLLISIFFLPWWISLGLAAIFVFYFAWYYEILCAGFFIDSLYGSGIETFHGFVFVATLFGILLLLISLYVKSRIRI